MRKHAEGMHGGSSVQELLKSNQANIGGRKARRQAENRAERKKRFGFGARVAGALGLAAVMAFGGVHNGEKAQAAPAPMATGFDTVPALRNVPQLTSAPELQLAPVAAAMPMAEQAPVAASGKDWDRLATCESGDVNIPGSGQWNRTDGIFDGGLQFQPSTWDGFGGGAYAPTADQATREQQIEIAEKVFDAQGPGAWPTCSYEKVPGWWEGGPAIEAPAPAPAPEAPIPAPMPIPEVAPIVPFCDRVVPGSILSSGFGMRDGVMHDGADCAAPDGTEIHALEGGTVIDAGPAQGFGWWVRIAEDDGGVGTYGHMWDDNVEVGQHVNTGDVIAWVGSNGESSGPHVHVRSEGEGDPVAVYGDGPAPGFNQAPAPAPEAPIPAPEAPALPPEVQAVVPEQLQPYVPEAEPAPEQTWTEPVVPPEAQPWIEQNVPQYEELVPTPAPAPEQFQEPAPAPMPEWVPPQNAEQFTQMQKDLDAAIENFNNMFAQPQPR